MEMLDSEDGDTASGEISGEDLRERLKPHIEEMCKELLPQCRSSDHVQAFCEKIKGFRRRDRIRGCNSYETYFVGYAMVYLYERNCTDSPTVSRVLLSYLDHFVPEAFDWLQKAECEIYYTEWRDGVFKSLIADAVFRAQYGLILFLVKYGKCSLTPTYYQLEFVLSYFMKAMFRDPLQVDQIRRLAKRVDMSLSRLVLTMFSIETALRCTEARTCIDVDRWKRSARCIDLLARTTAEPLMSFIDVEEVARFSFVNSNPPRRSFAHLSINDYVAERDPESSPEAWQQLRPLPERMRPDLLKLFPDMPDRRQVRALLDLCRCKIRESVRCDRALTHQVSGLPLPSILKRFILFHDSEFAQCMWNDATEKFS